MIVWGSSTNVVLIDQLVDQPCDICTRERPFRLWLQYRVHHIWYLFRWVTTKSYYVQCDACGCATAADGAEAERGQIKSPIPFFDRFGWTLGVGGIAALFLLVSIGDVQERQSDVEFIATPRVNDLYEVDAARMSTTPEAPVMYTFLRVRSVTPLGVTYQRSRFFHREEGGVTADLRTGEPRQDNYYGAETATLSLAQLRQMHTDGIIRDVVR